MLERSVASSDRLFMTHALTYILERTVICLDIWPFAQALMNYSFASSFPTQRCSRRDNGYDFVSKEMTKTFISLTFGVV